MTKRLYEIDAYCREFKAKVISCELNNGIYDVVLDQTAFFPEGGGQKADIGTIDSIPIHDVQLSGNLIVHKAEAPLSVGSVVTGKIDWGLRFSRMQNHSAEHIVSGIVHSMFGYSNVGFHMSENLMTVDFDGVLSDANLEEVELRSNRAVYDNISITAFYPTAEQLSLIDYRSKIEKTDGLRLVIIGDVDCCACCAPHLTSTSQIGIIKIVNSCPNKGGTRVEMLAGFKALQDYSLLNAYNKSLMQLLSVPRNNVVDAAMKQNDLIADLRKENHRLNRDLAVSKLNETEINGSAYAFLENLTYDDLRFCSNMVVEKGYKTCVLFSKTTDGDYLYVVNSNQNNVSAIVKALNDSLKGKGGGRPNYAQGKVFAEYEEIKSTIEKLLLID